MHLLYELLRVNLEHNPRILLMRYQTLSDLLEMVVIIVIIWMPLIVNEDFPIFWLRAFSLIIYCPLDKQFLQLLIILNVTWLVQLVSKV